MVRSPAKELLNVLRMLREVALLAAQGDVRQVVPPALGHWRLVINLTGAPQRLIAVRTPIRKVETKAADVVVCISSATCRSFALPFAQQIGWQPALCELCFVQRHEPERRLGISIEKRHWVCFRSGPASVRTSASSVCNVGSA